MEQVLGVIGGSGLYEVEGLSDVEELEVTTPYGPPSSPLVVGSLAGCRMVFLARHGRGHTLLPSEVPYRANVYALKSLGVRWVISMSAVGSLREDIEPGDFVVVNQYLDRTKNRKGTFFGSGCVAHVSFGQPACPRLSEMTAEASEKEGRTRRGGTYICMEGPAFSTLAESEFYRGLGAHVVGMTNLPEAKLAREAELAYTTLAMVTDYDCWRTHEEPVTVETVLKTLNRNALRGRRVLTHLAAALGTFEGSVEAHTALDAALMTHRDAIPAETRERLGILLDRVLS